MPSNSKGYCAISLVIGASGGIGSALLAQLQNDPRYALALGLSRRSRPALLMKHFCRCWQPSPT